MALFACLIVGLVIRLVMAFQSIDFLTLHVLPDDAFYYFVIARNIAQGLGSTFDQLAPTNGYHPLWMALITPFFMMMPGRQAPVSAALVLSSLIAMLTAWLLYLVLRRLRVPRAVAIAGSATWFYSPMSIQFSLNGLETAVATGAALLLFIQHLRITSYRKRNNGKLRVSHGVAIGLAAGLALLARTDLVFLVAPLGLIFAWQAVRCRHWGAAAAGAGMVALLVTPWFAWNWHTFGALTQVSGKALPTWEFRAFAAAHPATGLLDTAYRDEWTRRFSEEFMIWGFNAGFSPFSWSQWPRAGQLFWWVVAVAAVVAVGGIALRVRSRTPAQLARLWPYGLLLVSLFIVHPLLRWSSREWYVGVPAVGVFMAFFVLLWGGAFKLFGARRGKILVCAGAGVLICVYLVQWTEITRKGLYARQQGFIKEIPLIENRVESGLRFASSDCGYTSYMSHLQVVNLDGLVNNQAFMAIKRGELGNYLMEAGIDAFAMRPFYLQDYFMGAGWEERFVDCAGIWSPVREPFAEDEVLASHRTDETTAVQVFRDGWYGAGSVHGVWNDGTTASLILTLPARSDGTTAPHDADVQLGLYGMSWPFMGLPPQTVRITADGREIARDVELPSILRPVRVDLPADALHSGGTPTEFVLHFSHAMRLKDIDPRSQDIRRISYNIRQAALLRKGGGRGPNSR